MVKYRAMALATSRSTRLSFFFISTLSENTTHTAVVMLAQHSRRSLRFLKESVMRLSKLFSQGYCSDIEKHYLKCKWPLTPIDTNFVVTFNNRQQKSDSLSWLIDMMISRNNHELQFWNQCFLGFEIYHGLVNRIPSQLSADSCFIPFLLFCRVFF